MKAEKILAIKGVALFTIAPEKSLAAAVETMAAEDIGSLVCVEQGRVVGMLTFREVLRAIHAGIDPGKLTVGEVMQRDPRIGHPDMDIDALRRLMVEEHIRYLPILDGQALIGVVSFHDVARAVLEEQGFENRMLKAYIREWPASETSSESQP